MKTFNKRKTMQHIVTGSQRVECSHQIGYTIAPWEYKNKKKIKHIELTRTRNKHWKQANHCNVKSICGIYFLSESNSEIYAILHAWNVDVCASK